MEQTELSKSSSLDHTDLGAKSVTDQIQFFSPNSPIHSISCDLIDRAVPADEAFDIELSK
jgi:hypothetical protein